MKFQSVHIKGKGRGKGLGFPTINLQLPQHFSLQDGIYAVWVTIGGQTYKGALHHGPIPVFKEQEKSLEVYLLNISEHEMPVTGQEPITIDVVKKIRNIRNFDTPKLMSKQIALDVEEINTTLIPPDESDFA